MFIYSIRASTIKFFSLICLVLAVLVAIIVSGSTETVYASADGVNINYGGMKTKEDRIAFISMFGVAIEPESETKEQFAMPENFDKVIRDYNQLQREQGLDLAKYARKRVTRFTYKVTNYNTDAEVYVNLLVYRGRIIACDISSLTDGGFVLPLTKVDRANLKTT